MSLYVFNVAIVGSTFSLFPPQQRFIAVLSDHLTHCDQEGVDYETTWFLCTLDNCRQLLLVRVR